MSFLSPSGIIIPNRHQTDNGGKSRFFVIVFSGVLPLYAAVLLPVLG